MDKNLSGDLQPSSVTQGDTRPPRFLGDLKRKDQKKNESEEAADEFEFDPREASKEDSSKEPVEEVILDPSQPAKMVKIGVRLATPIKDYLTTLL